MAVSDSEENGRGHRRIWVGRSADGEARLSLMDAAGNPRIQVTVPSKGTPEIEFLDARGKVTKTIRGDNASS
jgi:hypothetical protein